MFNERDSGEKKHIRDVNVKMSSVRFASCLDVTFRRFVFFLLGLSSGRSDRFFDVTVNPLKAPSFLSSVTDETSFCSGRFDLKREKGNCLHSV